MKNMNTSGFTVKMSYRICSQIIDKLQIKIYTLQVYIHAYYMQIILTENLSPHLQRVKQSTLWLMSKAWHPKSGKIVLPAAQFIRILFQKMLIDYVTS